MYRGVRTLYNVSNGSSFAHKFNSSGVARTFSNVFVRFNYFRARQVVSARQVYVIFRMGVTFYVGSAL